MALYLGIDTSNYTTSVAVYDSEKNEVIQRKQLLPVKQGELGLRQSDAVFHHTQQLPRLFSSLRSEVDGEITAVGVSTRPRSVDGSYMPCFTVGNSVAEILSSALSVPLYKFSHQDGHIAAALFSSDCLNLLTQKFIAFHVSGGTTEAVLVKGNSDYSFSIETVAKTLDLNAGQAIDRTGLLLGLSFPCGKELEKIALLNEEKIKVKPTLKGCDCCLSGLENICQKMLANGESKEKIAAFCIAYIDEALAQMAYRLKEKYGEIPLVFAGGVMSDSIIRNNMTKRFNCFFANPEFSTDNAAGIAVLAFLKHKNIGS